MNENDTYLPNRIIRSFLPTAFRKENAMTEYVLKSLGEALLELMKTKDMDKITIDELTGKARVGRATYFRNFRSKEELLTDYLVWKWRGYEKEYRLKDHPVNDLYRIRQYFLHCYSMRDVFSVILKQKLSGIILNAYEIVFSNSDTDKINDSYEIIYMAYGLFGIVMKWAKNEYREPPEEMADIFFNHIIKDHDLNAFKNL